MLTDILSLLLEACAGFFGYLLLLRFLLQWRRISFANPLAELTMRTTNWVVLPLRRILPGLLGLDLASLIPAWLFQVLAKYVQLLFKAASLGAAPFLVVPALVLGVFELLHMGVMILVVAMLLQAVLSWINPYSPLSAPVAALTDPLLRPIRRVLPPIANFDLSPLVALLIAQVVFILLAYAKAAVMPLVF